MMVVSDGACVLALICVSRDPKHHPGIPALCDEVRAMECGWVISRLRATTSRGVMIRGWPCVVWCWVTRASPWGDVAALARRAARTRSVRCAGGEGGAVVHR